VQGLDEFRPLLFPEAGWIVVLLGLGGLLDIASGRLGRRLRKRLPDGVPLTMILGLWALFVAALLLMGASILAMNRSLFWSSAGLLLVSGLLARFLGGRYPPLEP